jgi:hypothetical protein
MLNVPQVVDFVQHKFRTINRQMCRTQWPHGLGHVPSSPVRTLGSWVRISLEAFFLYFCSSICRYRPCNRLILRPGVLPTVYGLRNWKTAKFYKSCRAKDRYVDKSTIVADDSRIAWILRRDEQTQLHYTIEGHNNSDRFQCSSNMNFAFIKLIVYFQNRCSFQQTLSLVPAN